MPIWERTKDVAFVEQVTLDRRHQDPICQGNGSKTLKPFLRSSVQSLLSQTSAELATKTSREASEEVRRTKVPSVLRYTQGLHSLWSSVPTVTEFMATGMNACG